jgi:hypothetical protein
MSGGCSKKTLDTHYTQKVCHFQNTSEELTEIKTRLDELRETNSVFTSEYVELTESAARLERKAEEELDFYLNTGSILFNYYNIVENNADESIPIPVSNKGILKFFVKPATGDGNGGDRDADDSNGGGPILDRASLLEKYMSMTMDNYIKEFNEQEKELCPNCGSSNRVTITTDSIICCNACNHIEYMLIEHEKPNYKDVARECSYISYKRSNHLNEWVSQVQGKETTDIPEEVYDKILFEIKKERITNMATLTRNKIRNILKKLKLTKYYEHVPHILHKLNGIPIPTFEPELEEKLKKMFDIIQPFFLKHMPKGRKNFLSYAYILFKFIQLLGRDEFLGNFKLLKNREKLHEQDQVWKKICAELDWQFIPSI